MKKAFALIGLYISLLSCNNNDERFDKASFSLESIDSSKGIVTSKIYASKEYPRVKLVTLYYDNGNKLSECFYKDGKKTGECKMFYFNGSLQSIEYFKADKNIDSTNVFYLNGKLKRQDFFYENRIIKIVYYDTSGNILKNERF